MEKKNKEFNSTNNSNVNDAMLDELDLLFAFASPGKLKDTLMEVYLDYCLEMQDMAVNYKKNTENFYFLYKFLTACQRERKKMKKQKKR
jgi:hypothetical protein